MFIFALNRAHDDLHLSSLAWPSVPFALVQACAISVFLSWIHFPFLVTFFWSIPVVTLWCHWPYSFFLDFVVARCWKYPDEAPKWLMFKTKRRKGSWASSFFFFFFPPPGSREQNPGCGQVSCPTCHVVVNVSSFKRGPSLEEGGVTGSNNS